MRVYHFMEEQWACEAIRLRRLKISLLDDMNDPFELLGISLINPKDRSDILEARKGLNNDMGVLCFSRSYSNPVLWSHYGDRHKGICLGFDVWDKLTQKITYTSKPLDFNESYNADIDSSKDIGLACLTTKFDHWIYEDEVRVILQLEGAIHENGLYFAPFAEGLCLREVITGPRSKFPIAEIHSLAHSVDSSIAVLQSRLHSKDFKVVKNRPSQF